MKKQLIYIGCVCLVLLGSYSSPAQSITINELSPYNNSFLDENRDSKDWIELYNGGETAINLADWTITDNIERPDKWRFPEEIIEPKGFLLLFASGKDRTNPLICICRYTGN